MPGFSTATELTDVSGRGVGMDVVRDAISKLKGTVAVNSQSGVGTTFTIELPTNLGTTRAMMIECQGSRFAIPMQAIQKAARLDPESITIEGEEMTTCIDGQRIPLIDLVARLQLGNGRTPAINNASPILIFKRGIGQSSQKVALRTDSILGCKDIVIKTLGPHLKHVVGINGATIGGDGMVIPVLDVMALTNSRLPEAAGGEYRSSVERKKLAMVIDDSISVRRVTESTLSFAGWDVVSAKDGVDALEKLHEIDTSPDVFLCDMEMPRMDGLELMRQIREQAEFELTPIVMVTSRASEMHRHKAFEAGATEYMVKPFNEDVLLDLIERLVQEAHETVKA